MRDLKWWLAAILIFTLMAMFLLDIALFMNDTQSTVSASIQQYLGASEGSYRSAMTGFILGGLLVHFTRWK